MYFTEERHLSEVEVAEIYTDKLFTIYSLAYLNTLNNEYQSYR